MAIQRLIKKQLPNDGGRASKAPRLVVIVPDQDLEVVSFSRTIHSLAAPATSEVLLLTVVHSIDNEMASRRHLATIGSLLRDFGYEVESQVIWSRSWVRSIESLVKGTDVILCPPEMTVRTGLRKQEALGELLSDRLNIDIRPLPGYYHKTRDGFARFLLRAVYWVVILGILVGYFFLESDVARLVSGWVSQTLLIFLVAAEIGTVYLWTVISG